MKKVFQILSVLFLSLVILTTACKKKKDEADNYSVPDGAKNVKWDDAFNAGNKSLDAPVNAIAPNGSVVFVGGDFIRAGDKSNANHIALWDTVAKSWRTLGTGVNGSVKSIAVDGQYIYVAGSFTTAGSVAANNIACWDTVAQTWSALGSGVNGSINTVSASGSSVYVGGSFATTAGVPAITLNNVAKYDTTGHNWTSLSSGINGTVSAVLITGSGVFVGGYFITAGDVGANNIAKWFGSSWTNLGTGVTGGTTMAIAQGTSGTYIGGNFNIAGGKPALYIALWNGSTLAAVGANDLAGNDYSSCVRAIAINNNEIFAGGVITAASGVFAHNIAKWNGSTWETLGTGVQGGTVRAIASNGVDLFVGGDFTGVGDKACPNFARFRLQ